MATNISKVIINATKQKVWDVLTKPEFVKQWQYGSDLITTWTVNDRIEFVTKWEDKVFRQWGTVLSYNPTDNLSYTLFAPRPGLEDKPENYFTMTYTLTLIDGATQLEIIQQDNRPNAVQEEPQGDENPILQGLRKVAEQN